ncbi:50S ribosomal subunit protein L14 [Candidatus Nasuia deltocephalinicola str. NAS-ALF]|uniref:Large ribosomal subunit protein uL14 n=1 Tax=Candidatus Nasuia deltocephalinicola str. NAS-ALF TaxID=1343077 RepID=S5SY08_9PROT|nr:50S ribosomal subunit protein L14 [Candidatus Nasuia deltocephalinicola str. NAS-ALF]
MIQCGTLLNVGDNSGAKLVSCIKILGCSKKRYGFIGDTIKISVKKSLYSNKIRKGEIFNAVIIRTLYRFKREDGTIINFNDNSVVLFNNKKDLLFTRIFGPVLKELKWNFIIGQKLHNFSYFII